MKTLLEMKNKKEDIVNEASGFIEENVLTEKEKARVIEIERQYKAISNRLNEITGNIIGDNADLYDQTAIQLAYEQSLLQKEWDRYREKKQKAIGFERQLKVLLDVLDEAEVGMEFREDWVEKTIESATLNVEIEFKFKCGVIRRGVDRKKSK